MKSLTVASACLAFATVCPAYGTTSAAGAPIDQDILKQQVLLDRLGFTPNVIDGHGGRMLTLAIRGFQNARGLAPSGTVDDATRQALDAYASTPATIQVTLTAADVVGPFAGAIPRGEDAQAKLPAMGYSDAMEELAERYHTTKATLVALNSADTKLNPGAVITVPNVRPAASAYPDTLKPEWRATLAQLSVSSDQPQAAKVVVTRHEGALKVYDADNKLIAQFPATMGSTHDPLPIGHWKIQGRSYLPAFHYNPKLFWDAKAGDTKATIAAGPNGPVGVVWIDLDKPHYGIHGTPEPQLIGRTESHGCIRLTNWDAARLSLMVKPNTPAVFEE